MPIKTKTDCPYILLQDGATPLFKACHKGHLEVSEELLKHGASVGLLRVR